MMHANALVCKHVWYHCKFSCITGLNLILLLVVVWFVWSSPAETVMDSMESQIFQPHAARHMLKSSIKLWGGGKPYGTDKTGSLTILCGAPCALTYSDDEDIFLFNIHQKNGNMQTHMEEGEGDAAASRERPKKKGRRVWVVLLETQHVCQFTQIQTNLVKFLPHLSYGCCKKGLNVPETGSPNLKPSPWAEQDSQCLMKGSGKEDTVHTAANCLGKAIGWQQKRTQTQTNYIAWGAGVQPHVYWYWLCCVSP